MKKIMFNDRYGLTEAVLEKRKTMTRRIIPIGLYNQTDWKAVSDGDYEAVVDGEGYYHDIRRCGQYQIGEEVAVAQSYSFLYNHMLFYTGKEKALAYRSKLGSEPELQAGWSNKMFVRADLMPHRIRITNIRLERLQDITDEDCLKEGVKKHGKGTFKVDGIRYTLTKRPRIFYTPKQAFECLIDKICGKGTWERNPWVFVYEFELVK